MLLSLFMLINFADKVVLGLAAVPIMRDLALTPSEFGLVASSFFFLFSIGAIIAGFITNRVEARWMILAMALLWALLQFPILVAASFPLLLSCRILLGASEGPAYPLALHGLYKWFPDHRRGLPTALVSLGAPAGVIIAAPSLTYVIIHVSWQWAFGVLGMVGLIWVVAWLTLGREGSERAVASEAGAPLARVGYRRLLLNPTTLGTVACGFAAYWGTSLLLAWFTPYLSAGLGFSQQQAGWLTGIPPLANALVVVASAWLSQRALARGVPTRAARGLLTGGGVALGGIALLLLPLFAGNGAKTALMVLGLGLPAVIYVLGHPMISEFTPAPQRAAMLAIVNAAWTSGGILAPYVMGRVIEAGPTTLAGYETGIGICGVITLAGGVLGIVLLRPDAERRRFGAGSPAKPDG